MDTSQGLSNNVSIHAPREGCDTLFTSAFMVCACFNSRTPGGVRLGLLITKYDKRSFNSRTPGGVRP